MTLPLLISVPHAGVRVPGEVAPICRLTEREIIEDGDVGASEIYHFPDSVAEFQVSDVARAIVDLNRAEDDFQRDGVIKTHTCWNVPVYHEFPSKTLIERMLSSYHRPYHLALAEKAPRVRCGIDCHTMASHGPPIGPDPGEERPQVCLSNADGTCPEPWLDALVECFKSHFDSVTKNVPFKGGYLIRRHRNELPWIQLELSRAPFMTNGQKREGVLAALSDWSPRIFDR